MKISSNIVTYPKAPQVKFTIKSYKILLHVAGFCRKTNLIATDKGTKFVQTTFNP
jgi:hypothetical protein